MIVSSYYRFKTGSLFHLSHLRFTWTCLAFVFICSVVKRSYGLGNDGRSSNVAGIEAKDHEVERRASSEE